MGDLSVATGYSSLGDPAPVLRLSYDVLLEIFKLAAEPDVLGRGPLLVITHVCGHWRDFALGCPALWSKFIVDARGTTSHLHFLELYLQRSRDIPLSVRVHSRFKEDSSVARRPFSQGILELLAKHSDRLFSLRFTGDWDDIQLSGFRGRLPLLEILQLPCTRLYESLQFQLAPKLHILRTTAAMNPQASNPWDLIPCSQIRLLVLWKQPWEDSLQLGGFTNLTYLKSIIPCSDWGTRSAPLFLPHLKIWRIECDLSPDSGLGFRPPQLAGMLDYFTIPNLELLDIIYLAHPANLCSFLHRSVCPLKHLALRRSSVRFGEMLEILGAVPTLEHLHIDNGYTPTMITNKLFGNLATSAGQHVLVPVLREGKYMFQGPKLLDMLQSRVGSKLELVELVLPTGTIEEMDLMRLKAFIGIRVRVECVDKVGIYKHL